MTSPLDFMMLNDTVKDMEDLTAYVGSSSDDAVNHPKHYNHNEYGIECIDAIQASMSKEEFRGYLKGNALKYQWRYGYKSKPEEDLLKAKWYLNKLINEVKTDVD
tara:strand:- start:500 stop:814 length:315 start_codon:yes stop_codon:yes gene_type:complete